MTRLAHSHLDASWNCKGGTLRERAASGVRALIRRAAQAFVVAHRVGKLKSRRPAVIALAECRGIALNAIRVRVALKHRTIAPRAYRWQDSALVVRRRCKVTAHGVEIVPVVWSGPEGTRWSGKAVVWADVDGIRRIAVHQVWNPAQNRLAAKATLDKYAELVRAYDGPSELIGDWNRTDLEAFAKRVGGRVVRGHGVDNVIAVGLTGSGEPGPALGSDHSSVLYRMEKEA